MRMRELIDRKQIVPVLVIVCLYLAAALLTNPRGEFPLNDDWSYTRSAFRFGTGAGMHVDEWSAPSLVGQAIYGGALVRIFGASFVVLRISTLALSCGVAIILWYILATLAVAPGVRWAAVLSWVINPVQFCLAFTFMTEIPFLFFVTLSFLGFVLHVRRGSSAALVLCAGALGYAFLIRQMAVLFMAPVFLALAAAPGTPWRRKLVRSAAFATMCGLFLLGYSVWARSAGGSTPATQRKYELLRHLTFDQFAGNSFGILFYLSFMLLPLLSAALPHVWREHKALPAWARASYPAALALIAAAGLAWFSRYALSVYLPGKAFHSRMPFLLNVLYDTGLGPVTLDPSYYGPPETPTYPWIWRAVTTVVAAGAVPLGTGLLLALRRNWQERRCDAARTLVAIAATLSLAAVAAFEIVFSHTQEGGLFDRHILSAALPAIVAMSLIASSPDSRPGPGRKVAGVGAAVVVAALAWFSISGTHDYLAWNRIRWDFGRTLLASGVSPLNASCGFEFNAWYNYDTFRTRGNVQKVYYWWYDSEEYVVAMSHLDGYRAVREQSYESWIHHRPVPLYLLRRAEPPAQ